MSSIFILKKEKTDFALNKSVLLNLSKRIGNSYYMLFFDNASNSPMLVQKIFEKLIYCVGRKRSDRKKVGKRKSDKDKKIRY